jgi:hypothetical protein
MSFPPSKYGSRTYASLHGFASRLIEHCPYGACLQLDILHACEATVAQLDWGWIQEDEGPGRGDNA